MISLSKVSVMSSHEVNKIKTLVEKGNTLKEESVNITSRVDFEYRCRSVGNIISTIGEYTLRFSESDLSLLQNLEKQYWSWKVSVTNLCKEYNLDESYSRHIAYIDNFFSSAPKGRIVWINNSEHEAMKLTNEFAKIIRILESAYGEAELKQDPITTSSNVYNTNIYGNITDSNIISGNFIGNINQMIEDKGGADKEELKKLFQDIIKELPDIKSSGAVDKSILKRLSHYFERNGEVCTQLALAISAALMKWATI